MFKVNNKYTRTISSVFIANFEHFSHLFLVFVGLILNASWEGAKEEAVKCRNYHQITSLFETFYM